MTPNFLFLSVHDFRSRRKTCVHFMTEELAKRGKARFYSIGMSYLSELRGDIRADLKAKANRIETVDGVECYLQRSAWHPFRLKNRKLSLIETLMFRRYRNNLSPVLRKWIQEANDVFIESGMATIYIPIVRKLNPNARIIYWAADDLSTIGAAETIKREFIKHFDSIDRIRLSSQQLLSGMPHGKRAILAPHGINKKMMETYASSPFKSARACVSVGSMLFDPTFFNLAAPSFPDIHFHIIGAGSTVKNVIRYPNVFVHNEMPHQQTLAWIKHCTFGVAPYRNENTPTYLMDTSMKLRQFAYFGKPAVCPFFSAGNLNGRFGYTQGDKASIIAAIKEAVNYKGTINTDIPEWSEIADIMLP